MKGQLLTLQIPLLNHFFGTATFEIGRHVYNNRYWHLLCMFIPRWIWSSAIKTYLRVHTIWRWFRTQRNFVLKIRKCNLVCLQLLLIELNSAHTCWKTYCKSSLNISCTSSRRSPNLPTWTPNVWLHISSKTFSTLRFSYSFNL